MIFSEIYSTYYTAVAQLIEKAIDGQLNSRNATDIINDTAFEESFVYILDSIKSEQWQVITKDFKTPIKHTPKMPLTYLQKSFLKAVALDPRFKLFNDEIMGLDDVSPMYKPNDFYYFDKINDGDPYEDEQYIKNFKLILRGIKENKYLKIVYYSGKGSVQKGVYIPQKLEFSKKDDKFRLICRGGNNRSVTISTINVARIESVQLCEVFLDSRVRPYKRTKCTLILRINDERNALERCMLHFSNFEKETRQVSDKVYEMKLIYYKDDETEILIRILSFGPMVKVLSPSDFIGLIRARLDKQRCFQQ